MLLLKSSLFFFLFVSLKDKVAISSYNYRDLLAIFLNIKRSSSLIISFDFFTKGEKGSRGGKGSQGEKGSQGQKGMPGTCDTKVNVSKHFPDFHSL